MGGGGGRGEREEGWEGGGRGEGEEGGGVGGVVGEGVLLRWAQLPRVFVSVDWCSRRYRAGGVPNRRLKARLNAASDSYPTSAAMSATPRGVVVSARAASRKRHRVKYAIGGADRYLANRSTRAVRERQRPRPARRSSTDGRRGYQIARLLLTMESRAPASQPVS